MATNKQKCLPFIKFSSKCLLVFALAFLMIASLFMLSGCSTEQDGSKGTIWKSGTNTAEFTDAKVGDFFIDTDDYVLYQKSASSWTVVIENYGRPGTTADNIELQVVSGQIQWRYKTGTDTEWKNLVEVSTLNGADGATWLSANGAPTATLTTGKDGDFYLDTSNYDIYKNTDGSWSKIGSLKADSSTSTSTQPSPWYSKSAVFVGDSITYGRECYGQKYWEILKDSLQLSSVTGMGVSGSCISAQSDYGTGYSPLINRYDTIPQADLISIFMGTNDYGHHTPLGTIDDTTDVSFYGALNVIIPALQAKYPASRLVFITPMHRHGFPATNIEKPYDYQENNVGCTLKDYVDAIKEVCERYSVPVIDMFATSGLNPSITAVKTNYMPDGLHPNALGHQIMANIMKNWFEFYANTEQAEIVTPPPADGNGNEGGDSGDSGDSQTLALQIGNRYVSSYQSSTNRASSTTNLYLTAGTVISLSNSSNYSYGIYAMGAEDATSGSLLGGGWLTQNYTVTSSGWYGFALKKTSDLAFDFTTESNDFYSYFTITPNA